MFVWFKALPLTAHGLYPQQTRTLHAQVQFQLKACEKVTIDFGLGDGFLGYLLFS